MKRRLNMFIATSDESSLEKYVTTAGKKTYFPNTLNKVEVEGADVSLFFPFYFLCCLIIFPLFTRGKCFTPYLVFSQCSDANNESTRHSRGGELWDQLG